VSWCHLFKTVVSRSSVHSCDYYKRCVRTESPLLCVSGPPLPSQMRSGSFRCGVASRVGRHISRFGYKISCFCFFSSATPNNPLFWPLQLHHSIFLIATFLDAFDCCPLCSPCSLSNASRHRDQHRDQRRGFVSTMLQLNSFPPAVVFC
jgi:hypothetical protein